jgi:hypothetical protein
MVTVTVLVLLASVPYFAQQASSRNQKDEVALRAAMEKETVKGDLKGAIDDFKKVAKSKDHFVAVQALLRMAGCYQKLGDAEATKVYRQIIQDFSDQKDAAAAALTRLAELERHTDPKTQLAWFDRTGKIIEKVGEQGNYHGVDLSPDGRRIAVHFHDEVGIGGDIWIAESGKTRMTRLTNDTGHTQDNASPVWSPDGKRVAFRSYRNGVNGLYVRSTEGGSERRLIASDLLITPMAWSPDGRFIVYQSFDANGGPFRGLWVLSVTGDPKQFQCYKNGNHPQISPDGKWIAYIRGGGTFVQTFPDCTGESRMIPPPTTSPAIGGPRWRSDGKELYVLNGESIVAVTVRANGNSIETGPPEELFHFGPYPLGDPNSKNERMPTLPYAASPDGQRFLMIVPIAGAR